jgi:hypothetical protein
MVAARSGLGSPGGADGPPPHVWPPAHDRGRAARQDVRPRGGGVNQGAPGERGSEPLVFFEGADSGQVGREPRCERLGDRDEVRRRRPGLPRPETMLALKPARAHWTTALISTRGAGTPESWFAVALVTKPVASLSFCSMGEVPSNVTPKRRMFSNVTRYRAARSMPCAAAGPAAGRYDPAVEDLHDVGRVPRRRLQIAAFIQFVIRCVGLPSEAPYAHDSLHTHLDFSRQAEKGDAGCLAPAPASTGSTSFRCLGPREVLIW